MTLTNPSRSIVDVAFYLVNKNSLVAISPAVHNVNPAVLRPQALWNIETLTLGTEVARKP